MRKAKINWEQELKYPKKILAVCPNCCQSYDINEGLKCPKCNKEEGET
jgi:hypothetical protein